MTTTPPAETGPRCAVTPREHSFPSDPAAAGFWDRLGYDEGCLPAHLPFPVTADGQGPTNRDGTHHFVCWCLDPTCPLTKALAEAHSAGAAALAASLASRGVIVDPTAPGVAPVPASGSTPPLSVQVVTRRRLTPGERTEVRHLTQSERATYQSSRDRGFDHSAAIETALDGVHVDDVRHDRPTPRATRTDGCGSVPLPDTIGT